MNAALLIYGKERQARKVAGLSRLLVSLYVFGVPDHVFHTRGKITWMEFHSHLAYKA